MCGRYTLHSRDRIRLKGAPTLDGFFEWKRTGKERRPFYFQLCDELPFAFAGIWDTWSNRGDAVTSCAIITTAPNELVGELHDRMPAILLHEFHDAWLDPRTDRTVLTGMLKPFPSLMMKTYPVSNRVNSPDNDTADLLIRVDTEVGQTLSLF